MKNFTRIITVCGLSLFVIGAYFGSSRGYGLRNLNNASIRAEAEAKKKSVRGGRYFYGRSIRGGGMRFGK